MRGLAFTSDRTLEAMPFEDRMPGSGQAFLRIKAHEPRGSELRFRRARDPAAPTRSMGFKSFEDSARLIAGHGVGIRRRRRSRWSLREVKRADAASGKQSGGSGASAS